MNKGLALLSIPLVIYAYPTRNRINTAFGPYHHSSPTITLSAHKKFCNLIRITELYLELVM